jgi:hypothetical protein
LSGAQRLIVNPNFVYSSRKILAVKAVATDLHWIGRCGDGTRLRPAAYLHPIYI